MINAFKQIRLSNVNVVATGARLYVSNDATVMQSETGNFIALSNLNGLITTGSADLRYLASGASGLFYLKSNPDQYIKSGDVSSTYLSIAALTTFSGNTQNFVTGLSPTGSDSYYIRFPLNFAQIPKVQTTLDVSGTILYTTCIQARSVSGFFCLVSDNIAESGAVLNVMATINS